MGPLQSTVNGMIGKAVNKSSAKYMYVMLAYSKGPIRQECHDPQPNVFIYGCPGKLQGIVATRSCSVRKILPGVYFDRADLFRLPHGSSE